MHTTPIIIVAGAPGAGKSTLAGHIAARLPCPLVSRDAIKEGMMQPHTQTIAHDTVNAAFRDIVATYVHHNVSCVVEAAFQHPVWQQLVDYWQAPVVVICCHIDHATCLTRVRQRLSDNPARQYIHQDALFLPQLENNTYRVDAFHYPTLNAPTLHLDTRQPTQLADITTWLRSVLPYAPQPGW